MVLLNLFHNQGRGRPIGGGVEAEYIDKVLSYSPLGYWPMDEPSGGTAIDYSGNGYDGAYTGVTLGQTGIGDGRTCPLFDGANDFLNVYSAGIATAFDITEGSAICWAKVVDSNDWDGSGNETVFGIKTATTFDQVGIRMKTTANQLEWYVSNGGGFTTFYATGGDLDWMFLGITWSESSDSGDGRMRGFYKDNMTTVTPIGASANSPLSDGMNFGVADNSPITNAWRGNLAHGAIFISVLSVSNMADLATL